MVWPDRAPSALLITSAAALAAVATGTALAAKVAVGLGLVVGLLYVFLALRNLPMAIALWILTIFLRTVSTHGANEAGLFILFAWLGMLASARWAVTERIRARGGAILMVVALITWVLLSMAWAPMSDVGSGVFFAWLVAGAIVVVGLTTFRTTSHLRLLAVAFVAGAVASVAIAISHGIPHVTSTSDAAYKLRAAGGSGDPDTLAAGIIPAIALAGGLAVGTRRWVVRLVLAGSAILLAIGFAATQSRGGFIAVLVASVASLVLARHERRTIALFLTVGVAACGVYFAANPAAWARITHLGGGGTGRNEIWRVAWTMWKDHPVAGVGIEGFPQREPEYLSRIVLRGGQMQYAKLIAEQPHVVHNAYLELLTENGVIGLALFLGVVLAALRAALRAANVFERAGDRASAALSRSVFVATLAFLITSFFLSAEFNPQLWVLLAFGLALLCVAERVSAGPAAPPGIAHADTAGIRRALTPPGPVETVARAAMLD
jgi:hypothetical protein